MIKAEVADERSAGSAIYAVVLVMVNIMFFPVSYTHLTLPTIYSV